MAFKMGTKKRPAVVPELVAEELSKAATVQSPATVRQGGETVRVSFRMGQGLHRRLKLEAVRQGRTIVAMLEGFVAEHTPAV